MLAQIASISRRFFYYFFLESTTIVSLFFYFPMNFYDMSLLRNDSFHREHKSIRSHFNLDLTFSRRERARARERDRERERERETKEKKAKRRNVGAEIGFPPKGPTM